LVDLGDGQRVLVAGQKSGLVHAVDPDDGGAVLWSVRIGNGGTLGGIQWGSASDGANVYVALSDMGRIVVEGNPNTDVDPKIGGGMFALDLATGKTVWHTPPADCGLRARCSPAQLAAVSAIEGVAFSGSVDGHLRGYSTRDGSVVWDFDSVGTYEAVGGLTGRGGSMDGPGPAIAGGMLIVNSGYIGNGEIPGNVLLGLSVDGK
jgi:polyvinyl alcohol dehydrogenase (cytochrome)